MNDPNELENNFRRQLHRTYLGFVEGMIKPSSKDGANANLAISRSDIQLFVEQHLDKIEESVKEQLAASKEGDLNYRHYAVCCATFRK